MAVTRRALLRGGLAGGAALVAVGAGVATDVLPGRTRVVTALDGLLPVPAPGHAPGPVRTGRFTSAARAGAEVGWVVAYPPSAAVSSSQDRLPVVLALHGQGGDASVVPALHLPGYLADAVAAGSPPFAIAAADGGSGYWHARRDGGDAQAMLLDEFLPALAALPAAPGTPALAAGPGDRFGLIGWSAGGFGALLLAERLGAPRVAGVVAVSPALWRRADDTVAGAFDDAADFAAHDVFAGRPRLAGVPVRIDCGTGDPFVDAAQDFAAGLTPRPAGGWDFGGHEASYWQRVVPAQLTFLARSFGG